MDNTLLVPMELEALVANNQLIQRDTLRWWTFNYAGLDKFKSAEPLPFNQYVTGQGTGVYLHWTLPRSLRTGNSAAGSSAYPLIPNRWLILRMARGQANPLSGWLLESDCPTSPSGPAAGASFYLIDPSILNMWTGSSDNFRKTANVSSTDPANPMIANLGVPFDPASWSERAAKTMFLTAVAPGNAEFSEYVAHNTNVFSFYDPLTGIDNDTISYFVTGWYSDTSKDIVVTGSNGYTGGSTIDEVLSQLSWTLAQDAAAAAVTSSVYTGSLFSISWNRTGPPPAPDALQDIRTTKKLNVAVGNDMVDAFSTLLGQQLAGYENAAQTISLLRAFHYDLLPLLNEVNGDAILEQTVRDAWFNSKPGGTRWTIVREGADGSTDDIPVTDAEAAWLQQLNTDQANLDSALELLFSLQWQLNAAWWKRGHIVSVFPNTTGYTQSSFDPLLDPSNPKSLLSQVLAQLTLVNGLTANVPQPVYAAGNNDQQAFQAGVSAFVATKGLQAGLVLKAMAQPRYWKAGNPVVVVSGVQPSTASDTDQDLVVRLPSQTITNFLVNGVPVNTGVLGNLVPAIPNLSAFPAVIGALFQEFFLLDPSNAAVIAGRIGQPIDAVQKVMNAHDLNGYPKAIFPDQSLAPWAQGWNPMYMEWRVNYTYVPFASNGKANWNFNGTDYALDPNATADPATIQIGGISLLSPHAQNVFGERLNKFVQTYGDQDQLKELYDWIDQVDSWQFLTQELVGFGDMLTQRDGRAFRRPGVEQFSYNGTPAYYADVIGYPGSGNTGPITIPAAALGQVGSVPYILNDVIVPFHGVREGQIYFTDLILYDKFGRTLNLILSGSGTGLYDAKNFPLIRDTALNIDKNLTPAIAAPAQLPPRLNQPSRLDMLLTDQLDDSKILGVVPGVDPVCGWIIPNHLDQSLLVYASDGTALGELSLIAPVSGPRVVNWNPPPHSAVTMTQVQSMAPHIAAFIAAALGRSEAEFTALVSTIDSTLWTIDPLGDRSDKDLTVLIGRPLALVRTTLQFSIEGQPLTDAGWASTFNPPQPDFTAYNFGIRLGDQATREDGVIGYFTEKNYGIFNSVVKPAAGQTYVQQIGPLGGAGGNYIDLQFNNSSKEVITVLMDPRASIHATTGLLPVKKLDLPQEFTTGPLTNMEVSFQSGPVLTQVLETSTPGASALSLLPLAEQNGTWSWWEKTAKDSDPSAISWQSYSLANATPNAELKGTGSSLREGILQLVTDLQKKAKPSR